MRTLRDPCSAYRGFWTVLQGNSHEIHKDAQGNELVERIVINGMGHGTPVDPGEADEQCGAAAAFVLDVNVCSSYYIAKFWGLDDEGTHDSMNIRARLLECINRIEEEIDAVRSIIETMEP